MASYYVNKKAQTNGDHQVLSQAATGCLSELAER